MSSHHRTDSLKKIRSTKRHIDKLKCMSCLPPSPSDWSTTEGRGLWATISYVNWIMCVGGPFLRCVSAHAHRVCIVCVKFEQLRQAERIMKHIRSNWIQWLLRCGSDQSTWLNVGKRSWRWWTSHSSRCSSVRSITTAHTEKKLSWEFPKLNYLSQNPMASSRFLICYPFGHAGL